MSDFTERSIPDMTGKTVLVTGANTGIGYEAARMLAGQRARVLLGCRSPDKARAAREAILAEHPEADVEFVRLELGDLASVKKAAEHVDFESRLDLLINNAGIMMPPRQLTADGFESQFGVNHLGHFALTGLLLAKLQATPGSRVVNVSSAAHRWGDIDFDDLDGSRRYNRRVRYGMSKLANLLFTYELQRRLEAAGADLISVASHPGVSPTELSRHMSRALMILAKPFFWAFTHPPAEAALTTVRAATDPNIKGGQYVGPAGFQEAKGPPVVVRSNRASRDPERASRLWDLSIELTGVDPGL